MENVKTAPIVKKTSIRLAFKFEPALMGRREG